MTTRDRRLIAMMLVLVVAGWVGRGVWDDRSDRAHCKAMVTREGELQEGSRLVEDQDGRPLVVDDGLTAAQRASALRRVRAEVSRCLANEIDAFAFPGIMRPLLALGIAAAGAVALVALDPSTRETRSAEPDAS